jgi:hypothetical protein
MKLQHIVAECNLQNLNNPTIFNVNESEKASTSIELPLFDILGREVKTPIAIGNVLVFGNKSTHIEDIALKIYKGFIEAGHTAKLVKATEFLTIRINNKINESVLYVNPSDDAGFSLGLLKQVITLTTTQIIFKVPSINWQHDAFLKTDERAEIPKILQAFDIESPIHVGLIASLYDKEFCIFDGRAMLKRMLD